MGTFKFNYSQILSYVLAVILTIIVVNQCSNTDKLKALNTELKKENKASKTSIKKYVDSNNNLNEKISKLENAKVKVKKEVVEKVKIIYKEKEKAKSFTTNDFAKYYSNRYNDQVLASSNGVILEDITALKNVQELLDKDAMVFELHSLKKQLILEEKKSSLKDTIVNNLNLIITEKDKTLERQNEIILNTEKSVRKQKIKKNFWKITTMAVIGGAAFLAATN